MPPRLSGESASGSRRAGADAGQGLRILFSKSLKGSFKGFLKGFYQGSVEVEGLIGAETIPHGVPY